MYKDFPIEIQNQIQKEVELQGNRYDSHVGYIQEKLFGGFNWECTKDGSEFWKNVLHNEDFVLFYKTYPKSKFNIGDIIEFDKDYLIRPNEIPKFLSCSDELGDSHSLVIHGSVVFIKNEGEIVEKVNDHIYMVKYIDTRGNPVILGFEEKYLKLKYSYESKSESEPESRPGSDKSIAVYPVTSTVIIGETPRGIVVRCAGQKIKLGN